LVRRLAVCMVVAVVTPGGRGLKAEWRVGTLSGGTVRGTPGSLLEVVEQLLPRLDWPILRFVLLLTKEPNRSREGRFVCKVHPCLATPLNMFHPKSYRRNSPGSPRPSSLSCCHHSNVLPAAMHPLVLRLVLRSPWRRFRTIGRTLRQDDELVCHCCKCLVASCCTLHSCLLKAEGVV